MGSHLLVVLLRLRCLDAKSSRQQPGLNLQRDGKTTRVE